MRKLTTMDLMQRVDQTTPCSCWIWKGKKDSFGYGHIKLNGKHTRAHRVFYEHMVKPIPEGMLVLHKCDNPSCCNPDHLFIGTQKENMEDMKSKGRKNGGPPGEKHYAAKITADIAKQIHDAAMTGATIKELMSTFNVSRNTAKAIMLGKSWKHITGGVNRNHIS